MSENPQMGQSGYGCPDCEAGREGREPPGGMSTSSLDPHSPHPKGPRFPFLPHEDGAPYFLTDGYGYGAEVSRMRWWWQRLKQRIGVLPW